MERNVLKQVIADQQQYQPPKNFFNRSEATEIQRFLNDPSILIMSGMRRSGKSTIQRQFQQSLLKSDYYLNFDDERFQTTALT